MLIVCHTTILYHYTHHWLTQAMVWQSLTWPYAPLTYTGDGLAEPYMDANSRSSRARSIDSFSSHGGMPGSPLGSKAFFKFIFLQMPIDATFLSLTSQTSTIPWVCYRRHNLWLRLALALFCHWSFDLACRVGWCYTILGLMLATVPIQIPHHTM